MNQDPSTIARVVSAVPLQEAEKQTLTEMITKMTGSAVTIREEVDPNVLGGIRVEIGDFVVDTTIARQLEKLSLYLTK